MAEGIDARLDEINVTTLKPNRNLMKLRADLEEDANLRRELAEDPSAVIKKYGLTIALPAGTLRRLSTGGGFTLPGGAGLHADAHADAHVDIDPHVDFSPHIDLF